jgi:hemolysin activation/secretion protein
LQEYDIGIEIPLGVHGTRLRFSSERVDADQVEPPFNAIDVASEDRSYEIGIFHPLYRTPSQLLEVGATLAYRESTTLLLGEPFSFAPGVQDGVSKVAVLRFSQSWTDRGPNTVFAARSTFNIGFDGFGATINPRPLPDGRFFSWLGQVQYARRLSEDGTQVILRAAAQLAANRLLPLEQFAIGGIETVRGYRQDELVRDNGLDASIEFRVPVLRPVLPDREDLDLGPIQLAAFADYGRSWYTSQPTPSPRSLASVGVGLLWDPVPKLHFAIYYGLGLVKVPPPPSRGLQDYGIHFRLTYEPF